MYSVVEKYTRVLKSFRDDGISVPVLPSEMRQLISEFLALKEHCAALESREVCTVAHDDVETCGYCQRDALAARLAEAERDAKRYQWLRCRMTTFDVREIGSIVPVDNDEERQKSADVDAAIDAAMPSETVGDGQ